MKKIILILFLSNMFLKAQIQENKCVIDIKQVNLIDSSLLIVSYDDLSIIYKNQDTIYNTDKIKKISMCYLNDTFLLTDSINVIRKLFSDTQKFKILLNKLYIHIEDKKSNNSIICEFNSEYYPYEMYGVVFVDND